MQPLPQSFYSRSVHEVARDLVGCKLLHNGVGGIIVETEAYNCEDPAAHVYLNKKTERNKVMFGPPGRAYVYFTYGMHYLLNIVCEREGHAAGTLLRALEPTDGIEEMRRRRAPVHELSQLTNGPGKICQALDIDLDQYGLPVYRGELEVFARPAEWQNPKIISTPRIGIRIGIKRKWRYVAADSTFLSRKLTAKERGK